MIRNTDGMSMYIYQFFFSKYSDIAMVLILDGNSEHAAQVCRKIGLSVKEIILLTALILIKCLKQIK